MSRSIHTLTIPSSTRFLEDVRRFVEQHALEADFAAKDVGELKIAVDEACANVIEHAYKGDDSHNIDVDVIVRPDRFTVRIRDEGESFSQNTYQEPDIFDFARQGKAGGFGVQIMRRLMDHVEYRAKGRSNECSLTKYR
ncbi:MAG: ATP-binding protein [Rhodothermales bacterium]|nr:ATP-binding protein [Rhodothermales bacterium]